jgi:hypothetical protein
VIQSLVPTHYVCNGYLLTIDNDFNIDTTLSNWNRLENILHKKLSIYFMALKKIIQRPTPVPIYSSHSLIYNARPHFLQLKKCHFKMDVSLFNSILLS